MYIKTFLYSCLLEKTDNAGLQFFRSVIIGGIATVVDFCIAAVAREIGGCGDILSNTLGFCFGVVVNFLLSRNFVFSKRRYGQRQEFLMFTFAGVIGLFISNGIIYSAQYLVDTNMRIAGLIPVFYLVKLLATVVTLIWNFSARKYVIYA